MLVCIPQPAEVFLAVLELELVVVREALRDVSSRP